VKVTCLQENNPLLAKIKLIQLHPFIDKPGTIILGGRLQHSTVNVGLLYNHSRFTKLLMQQEHTNELSAGPHLLHIILQQQFWVIWARNAICSLVYKCVICYCHRKQMNYQQMTDFQHLKPFLEWIILALSTSYQCWEGVIKSSKVI